MRTLGPCLCGDPACPSCGLAQGYGQNEEEKQFRCAACGRDTLAAESYYDDGNNYHICEGCYRWLYPESGHAALRAGGEEGE